MSRLTVIHRDKDVQQYVGQKLKRPTRKALIETMIRYREKHGKWPRRDHFGHIPWMFPKSQYLRGFGGWTKAVDAAKKVYDRRTTNHSKFELRGEVDQTISVMAGREVREAIAPPQIADVIAELEDAQNAVHRALTYARAFDGVKSDSDSTLQQIAKLLVGAH